MPLLHLRPLSSCGEEVGIGCVGRWWVCAAPAKVRQIQSH